MSRPAFIKLVFMCTVFFSMTEEACPHIVTRAEWGARESKSINYLTHQPVPYVFIHHSAGRECFNLTSCISVVRGYQNFHMDTRGWDDIGYSFVVGGDGTVFEGRGWDRIGAHTLGYNSVGLGICLSGDFTDHLPPHVQMDAVKSLIDCGVALGKIDLNYTLRGHRDMKPSTSCPGDTLYAEIRTWPHYFLNIPTSDDVNTTFNDVIPTPPSALNTEATPRLYEVKFEANDVIGDSAERAFTGSVVTPPVSDLMTSFIDATKTDNLPEPSAHHRALTDETNFLNVNEDTKCSVSLTTSRVNDLPRVNEDIKSFFSLPASKVNDLQSVNGDTAYTPFLTAYNVNDSPSVNEDTKSSFALPASKVNDLQSVNEDTASTSSLTTSNFNDSPWVNEATTAPAVSLLTSEINVLPKINEDTVSSVFVPASSLNVVPPAIEVTASGVTLKSYDNTPSVPDAASLGNAALNTLSVTSLLTGENVTSSIVG